MTMRTFLDAGGNEWEAFDVVPRAEERRGYDRRSSSSAAKTTDEERREADRRLTVGGSSTLSSNLQQGWLCFERGSDRRRLAPIPENWQRMRDEELDSLRERARIVRLNSTSLRQLSGRDQ